MWLKMGCCQHRLSNGAIPGTDDSSTATREQEFSVGFFCASTKGFFTTRHPSKECLWRRVRTRSRTHLSMPMKR